MKKNSSTGSFENVKNQIGYCGIWCGSCAAGTGALRELTRKYKHVIDAYDLKNWTPGGFNFEEFMKGLDSILDMPICPGCLKGGGVEKCEIRICAVNKKISGCTRCGDVENCSHAEKLEKMRSGAQEAGLFMEVENDDREKLLAGWMAELKSRWPCSILFLEEKKETPR